MPITNSRLRTPTTDGPAVAPVPKVWDATAVDLDVTCEVAGDVELVGPLSLQYPPLHAKCSWQGCAEEQFQPQQPHLKSFVSDDLNA
ncbi:hypothetical protein E6O75_ATG06619 [Venturia nashicola]|uniref:Uncharacterized protein n=1 Tax=Venturia nashicola TaxID=86259 RepID=A0A4Z1NYC4_9PEZI|nr:hypothetical protein E6O75_ATG06619 [Venturia nashicola]